MATPGKLVDGGAVAGDDVDDAGVVDQVDVVGARIGDGDAVGAKRDAAGVIEDGSGGGDVVRAADGAAAGDDAALPAGVDLGDVVDRAAHGDEEVVEAVDRHGIDVEQTCGIREIDGAVRAEAGDAGAGANPGRSIGDIDVTRAIDRHGGGRDQARALGHDDLSGTAGRRIEEDIGGGGAVALLQHIGVAGRVGGDGDGGAQAGGAGGGHTRSQQAERAEAQALQFDADQLAAD